MIDLKSNEKLYYVRNEGCDAETEGLVVISDEDFPKFKEFIENLNRNSTYACMPTICVYKIDVTMIEEVTGTYGYPMYLNDKEYKPKDGLSLWSEEEQVI